MNGPTANMTFILALQTSALLGVLHGVSPCEHSWPILAPFCVGSRNMKLIMRIGLMFCLGTTLACLLLGATLGFLGSIIPPTWSIYIGAVTSTILILLGLFLIFKPDLFHYHGEDQNHHLNTEDSNSKEGENCRPQEPSLKKPAFKHGISWGMFSLGFINMIAPCPTSAVMYSYALIAKSFTKGIAIFLAYALTTTVVLMSMAFLLVKTSQLITRFGQEKNEILITRISGALIAAFGGYMLLIQFPAFKYLKVHWIL